MRAVKSKDTAPELVVRRIAHGLGFRFRLHVETLPGKPDLVFRKRMKIVMVNGCFWHGHDCDRGSRKPKSNSAYWLSKIARNVERDRNNDLALRSAGWAVMTIWECETKLRDQEALARRLDDFLST